MPDDLADPTRVHVPLYATCLLLFWKATILRVEDVTHPDQLPTVSCARTRKTRSCLKP